MTVVDASRPLTENVQAGSQRQSQTVRLSMPPPTRLSASRSMTFSMEHSHRRSGVLQPSTAGQAGQNAQQQEQPHDLAALRQEDAALQKSIADLEKRVHVEHMLKTSAEALASAHSDKRAKQKAAEEIQFAYRRIDLLSGELVKFIKRFREVSRLLRELEVQAAIKAVQPAVDQGQARKPVSDQRCLNGVADQADLTNASPSIAALIEAKDKEIQRLTILLETSPSASATPTPSSLGADHASLAADNHRLKAVIARMQETEQQLRLEHSKLRAASDDAQTLASTNLAEAGLRLRKSERERAQLQEQLARVEERFLAARRQHSQVAHEHQLLQSQLLQHAAAPSQDTPNAVHNRTMLLGNLNGGADPDASALANTSVLSNASSNTGIELLDQVRMIAESRATADALQSQLNSMRDERDKLRQSLKDLTERHNQQLASMGDWKKTLVGELQAKLSSVESSLSATRAVEQTKRDELQQQITALKAELDVERADRAKEQSAANAKVASALESLDACKTTMASLESQVKSRDAAVRESTERIAALTLELENTRSRLAQAEQVVETGKAERHSLQTETDTLGAALSSLQDTHAAIAREKADLERVNAESAQSVAELSKARADLEHQAASLRLEKADLERQMEQMSHNLQEAQANEECSVHVARQIQATRDQQSSQLQEALAKAELELRTARLKEREHCDQMASVAAQVQLLQGELDAASTKIKRITAEHSEQVQAMTADAASLKDAIAVASKERDALAARCESLSDQIRDMDAAQSASQSEYEVLLDAKQDLEAELRSAHEQLATLKALQMSEASERARISSQLQESQQMYRDRLHALEQANSCLESAHLDISKQLQETLHIKSQLADSHRQHSEAAESLRVQNKDLDASLQRAVAARSVAEAQLAEMAQHKTLLESKLVTAIEQRESAERESSKSAAMASDAADAADAARRQQQAANEREQDLAKQLAQARTQIDHLTVEIARLSDQSEQVNAAKAVLERECLAVAARETDLQQQLLSMQQALDDSRARHSEASSQRDDATARLLSLETKYGLLEHQIAAVEAGAKTTSDALARKIAECDSLLLQLDTGKSAHDSIAVQLADALAGNALAAQQLRDLGAAKSDTEKALAKITIDKAALEHDHVSTLAERDALSEQVAGLGAQISDLQEQLSLQTQQHHSTVVAHQQKLQSLSEEHASLVQEMAQLANEKEQLELGKAGLEALVKEVRSQLAERNRCFDEQACRYDALQGECRDRRAECKTLSDQLARLKDQIAASNQAEADQAAKMDVMAVRIQRLEADLASRTADCNNIQEQLARSDEERERVGRELAAAHARHAEEAASASADLFTVKREHAQVVRQVEELQAALAQRDEAIADVTAKRDALLSQVESVCATRQSLAQRIVELEESLRVQLQAERHERTKELADAARLWADQESALRTDLKQAVDVAQDRAAQIESMNARLEQLQQDMQNVAQELEQQRAENQLLQDQLQQSVSNSETRHSQDTDATAAGLPGDGDALAAEVERLRNELRISNEDFALLKDRHVTLSNDLLARVAQVDTLRKQVVEDAKNMREMRLALEKLQQGWW